MTLDFSVKGKVKVRIDDYVEKMIQNPPNKLKSKDMAIIPYGKNLVDNGNGKPLEKTQAGYLHTMVAKNMFLSKRARPDIQPTIYVFAIRVRSLNIIDWKKLVRVLKYLNGTRKYNLTLSIDDSRVIK